uniref:Uncharacterized protein n=1 Tax=Setaria viridis TaxID=4556 RepID=A0A4U6VSN1_SETVI|nr:hypothetical protein SEVIR_2G196300v2 [Setaria viridis]
MRTSRVLNLSLLRRLRVAAELSPPWRPRVLPARGYQSRGYSSGGSSNRPMRQFSEQNESSPRPLIHYIAPSALLCFAGLAAFVHYNDEKRAVPLDVGPAEVQKMADVIKLLESKYGIKITPLFITIDPQRDSPSQLKAYLSEFDPRIVGLTGPISAVRQIAQEYRVFFKRVEEVGQDYLVESSHNMYLLDPCLETVRCFGVEYEASDLAEAITTEVKKASASSTN